MGPLEIIKWGRRLVYVSLFIAFSVAYAMLPDPKTFLFMAGVAILAIIGLFVLNDKEKWLPEIERD